MVRSHAHVIEDTVGTMRRFAGAVPALALMLGVAACGDGGTTAAPRGTIDGVVLSAPEAPPTSPPDTESDDTFPDFDTLPIPEPDDSPFGWFEYDTGIQIGQLEVPIDYDDPRAGTMTLSVARHLAADPAKRIGTLLVNPGGPGSGGSDFAVNADAIYGQDLLDRFDIVGWDPRGTGYSSPAVDCIEDDDDYFAIDSSPDTPAERAELILTAERFAAACTDGVGRNVLEHLSTVESARDMDSIREALGEDTISYFGFSYGSELGATWATLFPDTVRAAVLDGAVDPTVDYLHQNLQQAAGFDATFATFLAGCSASPQCAFYNGGDAEGAYDALAAAIDASPLDPGLPGRPKVTQGILDAAVVSAMYNQASWPRLEQALADAQDGDGAGLIDLYDSYFGRDFDGSYTNDIEAYFAIGCLDDHGSANPDDLFTHEAEFADVAPRLGRSYMAELTFCSVWPIPQVAPFTITGKGAGPIVVVGTTGDPATPLDSTRNMASALEDGRLVVVSADQHTGYGVSACGDEAIEGYLLDPDGAVPPRELTCS